MQFIAFYNTCTFISYKDLYVLNEKNSQDLTHIPFRLTNNFHCFSSSDQLTWLNFFLLHPDHLGYIDARERIVPSEVQWSQSSEVVTLVLLLLLSHQASTFPVHLVRHCCSFIFPSPLLLELVLNRISQKLFFPKAALVLCLRISNPAIPQVFGRKVKFISCYVTSWSSHFRYGCSTAAGASITTMLLL